MDRIRRLLLLSHPHLLRLKGKKSPAPSTNAPPPEKPPSSPPSDESPPSVKSPPPPSKKSPPPSPPPSSQDSSPPNQPPPSSQDSSPPNQPPPRVSSPPPQGGGTNPSPPRVTNPPAWSPPPPSDSTPPAPPDDHTSPPDDDTSPPIPPSNSPSPSANPSGPSQSSPRPSSSLGTPNSKAPDNGAHSEPNQSSHNHGQFVRTTATIVGVGVFVILAFIAAIFLLQWWRIRTNKFNTKHVAPFPYNSSPGSSFLKQSSNVGENFHSSPENGGMGNSKTWFTYEELSKATNGFASQNILGTGGFGCVYKGYLQDGREVAVKKLKDNCGQGDREFKVEVEIFTCVHHRHLVSLVGCCLSDNQKSLVYEYAPNKTLHYHLHASNKPVMPWPLRVKVACGSARGIAYLHEDCNPCIIHRDIKSANILLDNNFEAKVADFGLAKLAQELESHSHVSTRVMGTFGYMAPEYATSGKLTEKSDVFSFGVVLLEIITGHKPVDETWPLGDESLVEWARPLMSEAFESQNADKLADPRLEGNYDMSEMLRMIEAAAACVRHSATKRPKMTQLVHEFDTRGEPSDLTNGIKPGQSVRYDSREQSIEMRMFERMRFESQESQPRSPR